MASPTPNVAVGMTKEADDPVHDETAAKIDAFLRGRCNYVPKKRQAAMILQTSQPERKKRQNNKHAATAAMVVAAKKRSNITMKAAQVDNDTNNSGGPKKKTRGRSAGPNIKWQQHYDNYAEHVKHNGANASFSHDGRLQSWVTYQRMQNKNNKLCEIKKALLDKIGFDFTYKGGGEAWQYCFERLSRYVGKHGSFPPVNTVDPEEIKSRNWLFNQRLKMKRGLLSEEKARCFNQILIREKENQWENNFKRLEESSRNNGGDANIFRNSEHYDQELYRWAMDQRKAFKEGLLSDNKATRLKSIGLDFEWDSHEARSNAHWERMYANLVDYHKEHKHCNVPWHYKSERHSTLGHWVCRMKTAAAGTNTKIGRLDDDRKAKLLQLGFDFRQNCRFGISYDEMWNEKLKELIQYKAAHDGKDPPSGSGKGLGPWCRFQRINYHKGTLEQDRINRLREAGFDFSQGNQAQQIAASRQWEKMYKLLIHFYEENGHCNVGDDNPSLATWIDEMKDNKMIPCKRRKQLRRARYGRSVPLKDFLEAFDKKKCSHCGKFALFEGQCHSHFVTDQSQEWVDLLVKRKKRHGLLPLVEDHRVRKILEDIRTGKPSGPPKAASEVDFDIENPPELFREPSKLVTLDRNTKLAEHDAFFPSNGPTDYSHKGNTSLRELLIDFQPVYMMAPRLKRHFIAKSAVFIIQNRGGRFFRRDGADGPFHELGDQDAVEVIKGRLGTGLNAKEIRTELDKLETVQGPLYSSKEEQNPSKSKGGVNHIPDVEPSILEGEGAGIEEGLQSPKANPLKSGQIESRNSDADVSGDDTRNEDDSLLFQNENNNSDHQFDDSNIDASCAEHVGKDQQSTTITMTLNQESSSWETFYHALKAFIEEHGRPPQTREENPPLYDCLQAQKARQSQMENLLNSC